MAEITGDTSLAELAALVSQALEQAGISAVLSGGGAVSFYSANEYLSADLDFVTSARTRTILDALAPLGFAVQTGSREFTHPCTRFFVEFPPGPLAFGEATVADTDAALVPTEFGPLRIVTPTQSVMDRLAAFLAWNDRQAYDQAVLVARGNDIDWAALSSWASGEDAPEGLVDQLRAQATR